MKILTSRPNCLLSIIFILLVLCIQGCNENKTILRISIASDGHYGQKGIDYISDYKNIISWLNNEYETKGLDYSFFIGDLVNDRPNLLPEVKEYFDKLKSQYFVIKGNHEKSNSEMWKDIWGYPDNFDFENKNCAFIMVSTSDTSGRYICADSKWLDQTIQSYSGKKHIFIFLHISQKKWTNHGIDCPEFTQVIEKHPNITAIFFGHDHQEDGVKSDNQKHYFWDGHFGGSWGVNYKGYRILEINRKGEVFTYQYNPKNDSIINSTIL